MRTELTELPDSRVRLEVGIDADVFAKRIDRAAKSLAGEMKMPGFRKGKVPPQLVIQRIGREAVVEQAVRDSLPEWYEEAIVASGVATVGDPKLDVEDLPAEGEDLVFSIEIGVRPEAKLGDYKGIEVPRPEPEVPDEAVDREIERLREGLGSLKEVDRPSADGDVVVVDYVGKVGDVEFPGGSASDQSIELGGGRLLPEFEAGLVGRSAGEETQVNLTFPEDYGAEELAGEDATFAITVKEVREKELPELDDDFAQSASEFDTLAELRDEIAGRIREAMSERAEADFREAAVEAAADAATVEIPDDLIHARAHELWERFERTLSAQGIDPQMYAQMQGKDRHELISEGEDSARQTLRREATLSAIAQAEGIEPTDEELIEALGPGDGKQKPEKILKRLRENGRDSLLREEVRLRKAADLVADAAKPVQVAAEPGVGDELWTPEKGDEPAAQDGETEPGEEAGKLWTPGS